MDSEQLKARSIELAERAYRQKDRANDTEVKARLDDAADELIKIDNANRFFMAQSKLELLDFWTEEQRALAHELSVTDQIIRDLKPIDSSMAIDKMRKWAETYLKSSSPEVLKFGKNILAAINNISPGSQPSTIKEALGYLISATELILKHAQSAQEGDADIEANIDTILLLRSMRDSLLSLRELLIDNEELLKADTAEDDQVEKIELVRSSLNEIYSHVQPPQLPHD